MNLNVVPAHSWQYSCLHMHVMLQSGVGQPVNYGNVSKLSLAWDFDDMKTNLKLMMT